MINREKLDLERLGLLVVDMQHVYMKGSEFETDGWEEISRNVRKIVESCREASVPVVFIRMWYRPDGSDALPSFPRDKRGRPSYAVAGDKETEILEDLGPQKGEVVISKQRFSAFFQTNLDLTLQGLKVDHLIITGVSTDVCVLATVYDAYFRGYGISVVKDACGTETRAAHMTTILNIANWVYGCRIFRTDEMIKALKGQPFRGWFWERPGQYRYTLDSVESMYEQI